jgi:DNA-binding MarR family transcriptional regulator
MSDFKPRAGAALPFIEAENRRQAERPKPSPLTLLELLSREPIQSLSIFELQGRSGMEPVRYGEALKSLRDAGYITFEGEAPDQVIKLTPRGAELVKLAQPA